MIPLRDDNPSRSPPVATVALIGACVAVFLRMASLDGPALLAFITAYGAVPARLLADPLGAAPTLVTHMFLHGGWVHLLGNMLYLWIFGDNVEDLMGHMGFVAFYLLSGVAAVLTHTLLAPLSDRPLVGASGAVAGVLGAYLVLFPRARILSLVPMGLFTRVVAVPAVVFLPLWFVLQLVSGLASLDGQAEMVAWWAHVGGFVAGVLLVPVFVRRRRPRW
ncbi:MAG: rhomboid family intramembrane serine protease [Armatimonadota bacterium]|nr:rhomboid family intramembrane serine protease [Armatimonadota bacterium]MDR7402768.1 rhomboid family intramembrane serine protease [Armatimonadota bacterium]MDR7404028.1 rhomboid family intramembrane serine protease [Armatimonadota bacterium]MDR7437029.1 rhomboid family intramembrane serine protease [Armatimonadota bacterium]MDR7507696.1 rhomboid family intramembrane serine protease [Armatimonadota bacterium]